MYPFKTWQVYDLASGDQNVDEALQNDLQNNAQQGFTESNVAVLVVYGSGYPCTDKCPAALQQVYSGASPPQEHGTS